MENVCLVCSKDVSESQTNIYSELPSKNNQIYVRDHISQVVNQQELIEACKVSEVVCLACLKLLLCIDNLQFELKGLKDEFQRCFQGGLEIRRKRVKGWSQGAKTDEERGLQKEALEMEITGENAPLRLPTNSFCGIGTQDNYLGKNQGIECDKKEELILNAELPSNNKSSTKAKHETEMDHKENKQYRNLLCDIASNNTRNETLQIQFLQGQNILDTQSQPETKDSLSLKASFSPRTETADNKLDSPASPQENRIGNIEDLAIKTESNFMDDEIFGNFDDQEASLSKESNVEKAPFRVRRSVRKKRSPLEIQHSRTPSRKKLKTDENMKTDTEESEPVNDQAVIEDEMPKIQDTKPNVENNTRSCELCKESFDDALQLAKHRGDVHPTVYCYVCKQCTNVRYREKAKLTQHVQRIHKVPVHQCLGCNYEASSQNALDQHIISEHPDSRYFECDICHKAFRTYRYLNFVHIKRCHFGLPVKYTCEKCNKGFVDKSSFENHKLTHSESKNFTCEYCGSLFHTPYALKVHVNTHTQERKYNCNDCDTIFLRHCNLIAHKKRFHSSDDVKLVCEVCGKSMATQKDLKRHQIAQHSKEKPFSCSQCSRTYTSRESLKNHVRTHTDEKPYKCDCGKSFHKSSVLRRHQRSVHLADRLVHSASQDSIHEEMDSVHIGDEDLGGEERMVVITLKECNPPAVYTVRNASSHVLEEIMVANDNPLPSQESAFLSGTLPNAQTIDTIPVLNPQLGTIATNRIGLATPVLFTTLNTNIPAGSHGQETLQENLSQTTFTTEIASVPSNLQANTVPFQEEGSSVDAVKHERIVSFQEDTPATCTPLATQLLQLPPLQTNPSNNPQLTYVTTWPFPDR